MQTDHRLSDNDLNTAQFTFQDLSTVTGAPVATIKAWHSRKILVMAKADREAEGRGVAAKFSGFTAFQVVVMVALTRIGRSVEDAARAGLHFAHFGEGGSRWKDDDGISEDDAGRDPSRLFATGDTWMIVPQDPSRTHIVNVQRSNEAKLLHEIRALQFNGNERGFQDAVTVLPLDHLIASAEAHLDYIAKRKPLRERPAR